MSRVMVLADKGPSSHYLINKLLASNVSVGVVFEKRSLASRLDILKRRVRRIGLSRIINQLLLVLFVRLLERHTDSKNIKRIFYDQPTEYLITNVDKLEVKDVNSVNVEDFILSKSPDLVIVNGTSIIKAPILELVSQRIINIHVGITPEYRGTHGGFWAMYNGEPEMVGVTVHLIDSGIDSGAILFQERVAVEHNDTLRVIAYKQQKQGLDLVFNCLDDLKSGILHGYRKDNSPSKFYYSPGLTHYLKYRIGKAIS